MDNAQEETGGHALWRFSLAVYASPGVHSECIALQDAHGVDVNLLLFCAWLGVERGVVLDAEDLAGISDGVAGWQRDVVARLRAARRAAKRLDAAAAIHGAILPVEIAAERVAQDVLFASAARLAPGSVASTQATEAAARGNIALLLARSSPAAPFPEALLQAACATTSDSGK